MTLFGETRRLICRPFDHEDVDGFATYRSDPQVAHYQSWNIPFSIEQSARFISAIQSANMGVPGEWYQVAVVLNNRPINRRCRFSDP